MTGSTILIDTSRVPPNEVINCNCSVRIDASAQTIKAGYELTVDNWPTSTPCGIKFLAGSIGFTCTNVDTPLNEFSVLQFTKTPVGVKIDACFILLMGKNGLYVSYFVFITYA